MKYIKVILVLIFILLVGNLIAQQYFNFRIIPTMSNRSPHMKDNYFIMVDLDDYTLTLYKDGIIHKEYPVSGGTPRTPSPIGTWSIVSKANWGEGFGGSWMGFNVPWGKYGIHGTDEPWSIGKPLSKGCIRMYNKDVAELKKIVPHGTKVTIIKGPYGPFGEGFRTLKPGATGSDVYAVQSRLKDLGYYNNWVDGRYGDGMKSCVKKFQKDNNLHISTYVTTDFYHKLGFIQFE